MEVIIGTPGQHPSADLDPPMLATSPNSVPPFSNTSAEPPLCTKTLYTELEVSGIIRLCTPTYHISDA